MATKESAQSVKPVTPIESMESMESIQQDEFCSGNFINKEAKLPKIQPLRGANAKQVCYFINEANAALAGWKSTEIPLTEYTYEASGESEMGYALQSMRMLVCAKSPLMLYDKAATKEAKNWVLLGEYDRDLRTEGTGTCRFYHVILVDKNNQPMHSIPFLYAAKDSNQYSFSVAYDQFCKTINFCHAMANGIPPLDKTSEFYSLCVFAFTVKRDLVGDKQKSAACLIGEWEKPTQENWKNYFVGYDQKLKQNAWGLLMPAVKIAIPGLPAVEESTTLALPATAEEFEAQRKQLKSAEVSPF